MRSSAETRTTEVLRYVVKRLECADDCRVATEISSTETLNELGYVVTREDLVAIYCHVRPSLVVAVASLPGAIDYLASMGISPASIVRWLDSPAGIEIVGCRTTSAALIGLLRHRRNQSP